MKLFWVQYDAREGKTFQVRADVEKAAGLHSVSGEEAKALREPVGGVPSSLLLSHEFRYAMKNSKKFKRVT